MKRLLAVATVLLLVSPVSADPVLLEEHWPAGPVLLEMHWPFPRIDGNMGVFDLVTVDTIDNPEMINAFGAMLTIHGPGAIGLAAAPEEVRHRTGTEMSALVAPAPYAWDWDFLPVTARSYDNGTVNMAFGQNAWFPSDHVALNSLAPGTVVARFCFELLYPDATDFEPAWFTVASYAGVYSHPVFTDGAGEQIAGTVLNEGYWWLPFQVPVPEPATIGLMAAGLLALIARGRRLRRQP